MPRIKAGLGRTILPSPGSVPRTRICVCSCADVQLRIESGCRFESDVTIFCEVGSFREGLRMRGCLRCGNRDG